MLCTLRLVRRCKMMFFSVMPCMSSTRSAIDPCEFSYMLTSKQSRRKQYREVQSSESHAEFPWKSTINTLDVYVVSSISYCRRTYQILKSIPFEDYWGKQRLLMSGACQELRGRGERFSDLCLVTRNNDTARLDHISYRYKIICT